MTTVGSSPALTPAQQMQLQQAQGSLGLAPSGIGVNTTDFSQMLAGFDDGAEGEGGGGADDGGMAGAFGALGSIDPNTMHTLYGSRAVRSTPADNAPSALSIGEPKALIRKPLSGGGPVSAATGVQALGSTSSMDSLMSELVKILRELTNILAAPVNGTSGSGGGTSSHGPTTSHGGAPGKGEPPMKSPPSKAVPIDPIPAMPIIDATPPTTDTSAPPVSVDTTPPSSTDAPPASTPSADPSADPSLDGEMPILVDGEGTGDVPPAPPGA